MKTMIFALAFASTAATAAWANTISLTDLYDTGLTVIPVAPNLDNSGATTQPDPHYVANAGGIASTYNFSPPYYAEGQAPDVNARWISTLVGQPPAFGTGPLYNYTETFNLPSTVDLTSVILMGDWATDNCGQIIVNGTQVNAGTVGGTIGGGASCNNSVSNFVNLTAFIINSSSGVTFKAGSNTIDFQVDNTGAGSALLVTGFNGTANSVTPEPAGLLLSVSGFAFLGFTLRRRRAASKGAAGE